MCCALTRRLCLVLLRRSWRHVRRRSRRRLSLPCLLLGLRAIRCWRWMLCYLWRRVVYLRRRPGRRLRRMVCLPRLLLRLRTRRGSGVLCRLWTRSVMHLRRWLRIWTTVYHSVRTLSRGLIHTRSRLPRIVWRMRNSGVLRRSWYVLRRSHLLIILWSWHVLRSTCLLVVRSRSGVVRVLSRHLSVYGRQTRAHCSAIVQGSRSRRRHHRRTSVIARHKLGGVTPRACSCCVCTGVAAM